MRPLAFMQMALSPSASAAAAAAQRIHHHASASTFRTASLPPSALRQQAEEAIEATLSAARHGSIISSLNSENTAAEDSTNKSMPKPLLPPKRVKIVRHGQSQHNPRAEAAREAGCSFDEFLRWMELDDAHDAGKASPLKPWLRHIFVIHLLISSIEILSQCRFDRFG